MKNFKKLYSITKFLAALILISLIFGSNVFSQDIKLKKSKSVNDSKYSGKKYHVHMKKGNNPLTSTHENSFSSNELEIMEEMNRLKKQQDAGISGDKIVELQKKLESTNGSTVTKNESNTLCRMVLPGVVNPEVDNLFSTNIFSGWYVTGLATQVEQRGTGAGRVWVAVGHSDLDTGVSAKPDTIVMYYSDNGGVSYTEYMKIAFSPGNKIGFDDLDMEIIEPTSGNKYIYLVFGYYTDGYFGSRKIGYTILTTPTPSLAGYTLSFPGQTSSSKYFNARVTSDNARYPGVPYVNIVVMQDSSAGGNEYMMTKFCRILSPYSINPAITYFPKSIYTPAAGFIDYSVFTDIAYFNNTSDSLLFVLSAYPGFNNSLYFYKAFGNSTVYPVSSGVITPSGDDIEYARVAGNGGTDMTKMLITYTDNYNNSGDYDQWMLSTEDANNWSASVLESSTLHNSRQGDVLGRRNADGSFAVAFSNYINSMQNSATCTFNGNFNLESYIHCTNTEYSNSVINPKPLFRYVQDDSCLSLWSYYYSQNSSAGCSAMNFYLKFASEGYYDENTNQNPLIVSMTVYLADANPPYNYIDTALIYTDYQLLMNEMVFRNAPDGNYYLVLKHFNMIETWSAAPVSVTHGSIGFYDFTSSASQAFGNNMMLKGSVWCIYTGDVNQDGLVDIQDVIQIYNDALNFVIGDVLITDLNGDYYVDVADLLLAYNNSTNFVTSISPP